MSRVRLKKASFPLRYRLDVTYPDGTTVTEHDAYEFPPDVDRGELGTLDEFAD